MKFFAKFVLAASVAVVAIAVSAAPSEAAKKKKGMAPGVHRGQLCTVPGKTPHTGTVMSWGWDNKWYPTALTSTCHQPFCPIACR